MVRTIIALLLIACGLSYGDRPIQQLLRPRANPYVKPSYESHKVEIQKFSGCFASIAPWTPVSFTLISDDGSDLWVDGVKVIGHLWSWQHLPNRAQSTHRYPAKGGVVYGNKVHCITVMYRNAAYDPKSPGERGHQDGATLVAPWLRVVPCPKNDADLKRRLQQERVRQAKEDREREERRKKLLDQLKKKGPKGNNGVGNGLDPQPPGNPPINDGPGTSPGNPGNKQHGKK